MAVQRTVPKSRFATNRHISIKDFYERRKRILIVRDTGGLGDILMLRMIFEDFKLQNPGCEVVVATLEQYHSALHGHPFIDEIVDSKTVDLSQYIISYNLTSACGKYEMRIAPQADKHRSDIWASHCGIELSRHNMHLSCDPGSMQKCKRILDAHRKNDGPLFLFSPTSAIHSKDLDAEQINGVVSQLQAEGCNVVCLHKKKIEGILADTIIAENFNDFLSFINISDYIISVDTSTFHAAGGLGKPTVGVFSWADGKVYGRYFDKFILVQRHRDDGNWSCGPCYLWDRCCKDQVSRRKPCITSITSNEIVRAAKQLMQKWDYRNVESAQ